MDQCKIGEFLKELRKDKNITQEQLAEKMNVSRRTVSRWETGSNMPDLDILVELSDFYNVDLRDIFNGKRRENNMDREIKDTLLQAADYTQERKKVVKKRMNIMFVVGLIAMIAYLASIFFEPETVTNSALFDFVKGVSLGISTGMLVIGFIITSPWADNIMEFKAKLRNHQ